MYRLENISNHKSIQNVFDREVDTECIFEFSFSVLKRNGNRQWKYWINSSYTYKTIGNLVIY